MLRVGLTGGIGSGKSTVADLLHARGALIIDADALARQVVEPGTPALAELAARFGGQILQPDGSLDRPRLAALIFADPATRAEAEAIIHPRVREAAARLEAAAASGAIVVHVVPLLVETGQQGLYDVLVVVDLPVELQRARLIQRSALTAEEADARIAAQASRSDRLAAADVVIDNSGSLGDLEAQVDLLWTRLRATS